MPVLNQGSGPHPVDVHVGQRLRALRVQAGCTQERLAHDSEVAFQQLQKYERGLNRISASRLYLMARCLGCSVADFYEGLPPTYGGGPKAEPSRSHVDHLLGRRGGRELLERLTEVPDDLMPLILQLVAALSARHAQPAAGTQALASAA